MQVREAGAGRVLVVEDDESTALFVTTVLARHGFDAAWVSDAEQASARLDAEPFDVLLADYRLPGRSGMDLARETRLARPGIAIAVMTSFAESDIELAARSNGADDFFEKPLHSSNLVSRIGDLVTRSRASGARETASPSARGAFQASPMESAPEVSPRSDTSGPPNVAGSGSGERVVTRDTAFAPQDAAVADGAAQPRHEGADGIRRARSSALSDGDDLQSSGCEGRREAVSREETGREDRDLLARIAHPALNYLVAQRLAAARAMVPIMMWASGAPAISIGSNAGDVKAPSTRPGWSLAG